MTDLFTLGEIAISDFIKGNEPPRGGKHELRLVMDDDGAVRLDKCVPCGVMFGKYWYRSGTNASMKAALSDIVKSVMSIMKPPDKRHSQTWLDIGSNDGTLLSFVPPNYWRVGIDPVEDNFVTEALNHADVICQSYFDGTSALLNIGRAKIITSIAMFYDIVERDRFIEGIKTVLDDNGVWIFQQSYTPLMINQTAFDNICHEHYYYYSLCNIKTLLDRHGMKIMDCQINDVNGGSFRVYAMKADADERVFGSQPHRDVCKIRVDSILEYERAIGITEKPIWDAFYNRIQVLRNDVRAFIIDAVNDGKTIYGYGASTKGNTLLQYFGLTRHHITAIADASAYKHGLKTVETLIPIVSESEMRAAKPDYLLVLPWHFITEFTERESEYLSNGGRFIVPCPKLQIL